MIIIITFPLSSPDELIFGFSGTWQMHTFCMFWMLNNLPVTVWYNVTAHLQAFISCQLDYCNALLTTSCHGNMLMAWRHLWGSSIKLKLKVLMVDVMFAACPSAHPVKNSGHHAQGFVDFRSAIHRRTSTTPSDDAVSAVHWRSASLCAVDTHWDSQASVLCGGSERLELTTERHS